jgi:uncharacterized membrane protein YphA (DoxX/SURF4 family)
MIRKRLIETFRRSVPTTFRLFLGFTFLMYGLPKFIWSQFTLPGPEALASKSEGFIVAWTYFGYSRMYEMFIGVGEVAAAILIMIPKTARLGALIYFPIVLNIMMVNYFYDVGVQDLTTVLTLMCVFLLWRERKVLRLIFLPHKDIEKMANINKGEGQ